MRRFGKTNPKQKDSFILEIKQHECFQLISDRVHEYLSKVRKKLSTTFSTVFLKTAQESIFLQIVVRTKRKYLFQTNFKHLITCLLDDQANPVQGFKNTSPKDCRKLCLLIEMLINYYADKIKRFTQSLEKSALGGIVFEDFRVVKGFNTIFSSDSKRIKNFSLIDSRKSVDRSQRS